MNAVRERELLSHLASAERVTQRQLSRQLGIALGLTNLLLKRLVTKGWVRLDRVNRRRLTYLVTPAGDAAKTRLTREHLRQTIRVYRETRDRVQGEFARLAETWRVDDGSPPVVFYGSGEMAEIAYVCLQDTGLRFLGLVDPRSSKPFFGTNVFEPADLHGECLAGRRFAQLVVTSVDDEDAVRRTLSERAVPAERVWWL